MPRTGLVQRDAHRSVNVWIIYVALPALTLRFIPNIHWNLDMLLPIAGPFLLWCGAWLYIKAYSSGKPVDAQTRTALLVTCGLGNTAFLGFPLTIAYYGKDALSSAIVFDLSTFIIFCILAMPVILRSACGGSQKFDLLTLAGRIFSFPAFVASIFAIASSFFVDMSFLNPLLDLLVATISPLALFSIGLQFEFRDFGQSAGHVAVGLLYKLVFAPLLVFLLALILGGGGETFAVSVFEAGMPPHIMGSLLASQFNQNPRLCGLMVAIGIITSMFTTALLWFMLGCVF